MHLLIVEGLGVCQPDLRAFTAGNSKDGIGGGERFAIEKNMKTGFRRQRQGLLGKSLESACLWLRRRFSQLLPRWWARTPYAAARSGTRPQLLSPVVSAEWALFAEALIASRMGEATATQFAFASETDCQFQS